MHVEEPNTEYLGRAIASLRSARGMKRMDLKNASGLSYPYISEIENGTKTSPSLKAIAAIAAALDVSPAELQAQAEALKSGESTRNAGPGGVGGDPGLATEPGTESGIWPDRLPREDALEERITAKVLDVIGPQIRDLVEREVRFAVRDEILRQREAD